MAAKLHTLRLYRGLSVKGPDVEVVVNWKDHVRLRELLIERVTTVMRTKNVDLTQGWKLHVIDISGGPIRAKVSVDSAGRTVVR